MIQRTIKKRIEKSFFKKKAIIIYGARQVGKTTLVQQIRKDFPSIKSLYLNCDEPDIREDLTNVSSTKLKFLLGKNKLVFIDEAQRVLNIGLTIKLLVDNFPSIQVIATGSSSFDLANRIAEPLTGRIYTFVLLPFSFQELTAKYSLIELKRTLSERIVFGMYPEVEEKSDESAILLKNIAESYLYKDILQFQDIRRPELLEKLLIAIALQVGNEVSFNDLSNKLGVAKQTIANYINLLEKSFVLYKLTPFSGNLRNELTRKCKLYFYDTGIRNVLINNLNKLSLRQDTGLLWENFAINERMKSNLNSGKTPNIHFWRTHQQQEIDYLEIRGSDI
jgi:predicted AAA+ superfamily ATPase